MDFFDKGFQLSAQEIQNNLTWKKFFTAMGVAAAVVVAGIGLGLATGLFATPATGMLTGLFGGAEAASKAVSVAGWMVNGIFGAITVATCIYQANAYSQDNRVKAERLHEQVRDEAKGAALEAQVHQIKKDVTSIQAAHATEKEESQPHMQASPSMNIHDTQRQGMISQEVSLGKYH